MNTNTTSHSSAARGLSAVRGDLREARQERAAHRALKRELASYTTPVEVDDLLGSLRGKEGADVEVICRILIRNLGQQGPRRLVA
jgi:hypothetical protein